MIVRSRRLNAAIAVLAAVGTLFIGCSQERPVVTQGPLLVPVPSEAPENLVSVPGNCAWVRTGIEVQEGEAITISADGCVQFRSASHWNKERLCHAGPEGTYHYQDDVAFQKFPIPSAGEGPAPCYCLIGRIGDGPAFFLGRAKSWVAKSSGPLWLGINDFDVSDNCGEFRVSISRPQTPQPIALRNIIRGEVPPAAPVAGAQVIVFYIDGLRPDVVQEMSAMGHLPNIRSLFLDGGCWLSNTFTAFPSDTITSNGTMWTGCFSDRHGLKGQVRFSRRTLHSESYLEPLGPHRSARLLAPQGADQVVREAKAKTVGLFHGEEAQEQYLMSTATGVPPLFAHLRNHGGDWATGALPMMTEMPPILWSRSLVREMPLFHMQDAWKYIDDANTHYARWHLLDSEKPVTIIWLPETDSVSHKKSRGQFGLTRRTIARADRLIGQVVEQIRDQNRMCRTYFFLVSDHGHHGGRDSHLSQFDLANQFFYHPREISRDGCWVGGGLGLSVRQHRTWNKHPEDTGREFVFIDGDSDGAARIFLPRGSYYSCDWQAPSRPGQLLAYKIAPHLPPVNLIDSLLRVKAVHGTGYEEHPVDLAMIRLTDSSILISTIDRGQAVIDRQRRGDGQWWYRYTVVENVAPTADCEVYYTPVENPAKDPLGLLDFYSAEQLAEYYDERTWLKMTASLRYPDSVVALTRHMLWQKNLAYREQEYAPDIVVTARPGWYFGTKPTPGTTHGYPLADAMRATMFVSGPNIRRGAKIEEPARLTDLTPTILEMTGTPYVASEMDGRAMRAIYEPWEPTPSEAVPAEETLTAVFWEDVDLNAWHPLYYGERALYPHRPASINRPFSRLDLNNIAYNVLTTMDINLWRVADALLCPITKDPRAVSDFLDRTDRHLRDHYEEWFAQAVAVMDVPGLAIYDYNLTSVGNLKRADRAIDWVQERNKNVHERLAGGTMQGPVHDLLHGAVDGTQLGFWEIYRFSQRLLVQVLDETVLNSLENGVDRTINHFDRLPSEVRIE